jgi:hypothetical protein
MPCREAARVVKDCAPEDDREKQLLAASSGQSFLSHKRKDSPLK